MNCKIENNKGIVFEGDVGISKTQVDGEWRNVLIIFPVTEQEAEAFDSATFRTDTGEDIYVFGDCEFHSKQGEYIWLTYQTISCIVNYKAMNPTYQDALAALQTLGVETEENNG